jgi:hypothetical protein
VSKKGVSREPESRGGAVMMNRPIKFTPQVLENIKELLTQGIKRDEITKRLGVTVRFPPSHMLRLGIGLALRTCERRKYRNPQPRERSRTSDAVPAAVSRPHQRNMLLIKPSANVVPIPEG